MMRSSYIPLHPPDLESPKRRSGATQKRLATAVLVVVVLATFAAAVHVGRTQHAQLQLFARLDRLAAEKKFPCASHLDLGEDAAALLVFAEGHRMRAPRVVEYRPPVLSVTEESHVCDPPQRAQVHRYMSVVVAFQDLTQALALPALRNATFTNHTAFCVQHAIDTHDLGRRCPPADSPKEL